jgi:hypothetical protein
VRARRHPRRRQGARLRPREGGGRRPRPQPRGRAGGHPPLPPARGHPRRRGGSPLRPLLRRRPRLLPAGRPLRCLEKDPERRPRSAAEALAALEACGLDGAWTVEDARAWWAGRGRAIAAERRGGVAPSAATASRPGLEAAGAPLAGKS